MRVATDIGGTFTDLVYLDDQGNVGTTKSHTTPPNFEQGVMDVLNKSGIDQNAIHTFIHGTTVIINALTEKKGAKTGLITTKGFRDFLEIARGNRPDLFNIRYKKPSPFIERYLRQEVEERMNYKGEVITPLNKQQIEKIIDYFKKERVEAIAVAYLHSYANPRHEKETVELIHKLWPDVPVSASYEVTREWREYERTNTVALNAFVKPAATTYINKLGNELRISSHNSKNFIMQSNGGTTSFDEAKKTPINMVESGPVAGIYGAAFLGRLIGEKNIIAFDIGGTTAKCSLIENGEVKVETDYYIGKDQRSAGYPIKIPVVDIVEIGNGGGSIAWIDHAGALKVGPQSAGAVPGPVAYGLGGTDPTTTDANLLTGRLSAKNFDYEVDMELVRETIQQKIASHFDVSPEEAAFGMIRIANSNMLNALKLVSVRRGYSPQDFALIAFGGGGSMHAAALARELGVKKVIVPLASPVFSAWGMLMSDLRHDYIKTYIKRLSDIELNQVNDEWRQFEQIALRQFSSEGISREDVIFRRYADLRYLGQEHTVKVPVPNGHWTDKEMQKIKEKFHEMHEQKYTFRLKDTEIEFVNFHLTAFGKVQKPSIKKIKRETTVDDAIIETRNVYFGPHLGWIDTTVFSREKLPVGQKIEGPAIIEEKSAVTLIYEGQHLHVDDYGNLIIKVGVE